MDLRGTRGSEEWVFLEALEREPAKNIGAHAVVRPCGAVIEVHYDDKENDIDEHENGHEPREVLLERLIHWCGGGRAMVAVVVVVGGGGVAAAGMVDLDL